jgi:superfamily II DNA helicase RecQ
MFVLNWDDDFRPSFKLPGGLRALVTAPFMALTASAPPSVRSEIALSLIQWWYLKI